MHDDPENLRRDWRIPDTLWERIQPLLPPRKPHPLGCHRPRVEDRRAMDAIFFVLRTGCQWNALQDTGLCSSSSRTAASRNGRRPGSSWPSGRRAWLSTRPCRVLIGSGSRWTAR